MKILLIALITCKLLVAGMMLQKEYDFTHDSIYSDDLFAHIERVFKVAQIPPKRMLFRIKSEAIIKAYADEGYSVTADSPFITFKRKLLFDTLRIEEALFAYYKKHYSSIDITALHVTPRAYIQALPAEYEVIIPKRSRLSNSGVLYIIDAENRRTFFDFTIEASLDVIKTKTTLQRNESLSQMNTVAQRVSFEGYRNTPLSRIDGGQWRTKMRLGAGRIITQEMIEAIPLVKRKQQVVALIQDGGLEIAFPVVAQEDGGLYDMITVEKTDGEVLKARVVGANRVEIE